MNPTPPRTLLALAAAFLAAPLPAAPAPDARASALAARLTLEEEIGQLNQFAADTLTGPGRVVPNGPELVRTGRVGSLFNLTRAHDTNAYQRMALEGSRLHIPLLFGLDVIHGFRTLFPIPLGLSASWDPDLVQRAARLAARETSAEGVRWTFSPMVDIARDPRWGRIAEGAGEDPFLGAALAAAYVRGYQGDRLDDPSSILACPKHYVGYGAAEGGRDYNTTEISERTLRDVYLPPFHAAVDAGAGTIMSAFNALDGVPSTANPLTLDRILKGEWGFRGFVVSDWTSVRELILHGVAEDEAAAARKSLGAGVDMDMQSGIFLEQLAGLVRSGAVPKARVDDAVRRILRAKAELGLFERPYVPEPAAADPAAAAAGRELARTAAEESFVLLRNEPSGGVPLLPLRSARGLRIALIGPLAASAVDMLGSWSSIADPRDMVTLQAALAERAARDGFGPAVRAARAADVVVLALGESGRSTGEASARSSLDLPGEQEGLLEAVCAAGKPTVLVVFSGRPLALAWASRHVPAILEAWFPGCQAGPALADVLFGDAEPGGRLSVSVPRSVGQVPVYYDHLNTGRPRADALVPGTNADDSYYVTGYIDLPDGPLYPFGHGLGYTTFAFGTPSASAPRLSAAALNRGAARLMVSAEVANTGPRAGVAVAQLYIRLRGTSVARPVRELKGFQRIRLAPGERRTVAFTLGRDELSFWNIDLRRVAEAGSLYAWIAPDSAQGAPVRVELAP